MHFSGFPRANGAAGTRNYVAILCSAACAAEPTRWIARDVVSCVPYTHKQQCGLIPPDEEMFHRTLGAALDRLIELGGAGGFTETPELIGAEQVLAARATTDEVRDKLLHVVNDFDQRMRSSGIDYFGLNPDHQNIKDGLSSLEEKALGAVRKGGTKPLTEVVDYGEIPRGEGLFFVNSPGNDMQALTALAAAGCNVITYSTERAAPFGFPFVPVIKLTAREDHFRKYPDLLDYLVSIELAVTKIARVGEDVLKLIAAVASGRRTQSELIGYVYETDLWKLVPAA